MRRAPLLLAVLLAPALAGCWHADDPEPPLPTTTPTDPTQPTPGPRLVFGGVVRDALTGEPLADATVRLDVAQTRPCRREGIVWNAYDLPVGSDGRYGPFDLPPPATNEIAFFLHVSAPGRTANATFIGPAEARAGIRDMTILLHPEAAFVGTAPPGTLVALDAPGFPRLALADANGTFSFPGARAVEAAWAAATEPPVQGRVTPPADLTLAPPENATAWRLEGTLRDPNGAPVAGDVVAREGGVLVSVARAGPSGVFVLPLAARAQDVHLEARTQDGSLGGVLTVPVQGPPASRFNVLMRALC